MDIQPVISLSDVIHYLAKYASKSEIGSQTYQEIMSTILTSAVVHTDPAKKVIQKLFVKLVSERDISAEEVISTLMSYRLYHLSRDFVTVTLCDNSWMAIRADDE